MKHRNSRKLIVTWLIGIVIGTALIAVTSPLFVRSYLVRSVDPVRGVRTLPEHGIYRWRSEGYANTTIGPLGMPGKRAISDPKPGVPKPNASRIALWGDSQAEGVGVCDDQKLFAQLEQRANGKVNVFPLARSGDDATAWVRQIPLIESELAIDMHLLLIADLPDLLVADEPSPESVDPLPSIALPAFLIQAVRNLVMQSDGVTTRSLRFAVGPEKIPSSQGGTTTASNDDWLRSIRRLRDASDKPIWILYAPPSPQIVAGETLLTDSAADRFAEIKQIAESVGIRVINAHQRLCQSAKEGRWPHGFQNGQIGDGHLNADGYGVLASVLVDAIEDAIELEQ